MIDTDAGPLLIWVRDVRGADAEYESFDAMLDSLHFRDTRLANRRRHDQRTGASVDGVWTLHLTCDELANSSLLYDEGELNNQN